MDKTAELTKSVIKPKKGHQTDQYEGKYDAKTRLRQGQGTYHYANKYFTYTGNFEQGVKEGKGALKLGDGTVISGNFQNNQLVGEAEIKYADGSFFKGELKNGEKEGKGYYKSQFEEYTGEYKDNKKQGEGKYKTALMEIEGEFKNNKPDGKCIMTKYNYRFEGCYENGVKKGSGEEECRDYDNSFKYKGEYDNDKFEGKGQYIASKSGYTYEGEFKEGKPILYPNQFKVLTSTVTKQENGQQEESEKVLLSNTLEYEVQSDMSLNIYIESCFQGPEELDPVQPTAEQIEKMTKDWQTENKKNKNPPPMPDFNQPRMIKPELVLVEEESSRPIEIRIQKQNGQQVMGMKVDYRQEISKKRQQNELLKAEALKKAEEEGGKKGGKKDPKAQGEYKLNVFNDAPKEKQKVLVVKSDKGKGVVTGFQLPDDFPQASYQLCISSPFDFFGEIQTWKKELVVKAKSGGGKKK